MSELVNELRMVAERLFYESHPRDEQSLKDYNTVQRAASALEGRAVTDDTLAMISKALMRAAGNMRRTDDYQVAVGMAMLNLSQELAALAMQPPQPTTGVSDAES